MAGREISDAALRLFADQGFEATTIAQIAREAGVSQRTGPVPAYPPLMVMASGSGDTTVRSR